MGLALDEPTENEAPTRINGLDVLIAEDAMEFVEGSALDYTTTPYGERFSISSGHAGCHD